MICTRENEAHSSAARKLWKVREQKIKLAKAAAAAKRSVHDQELSRMIGGAAAAAAGRGWNGEFFPCASITCSSSKSKECAISRENISPIRCEQQLLLLSARWWCQGESATSTLPYLATREPIAHKCREGSSPSLALTRSISKELVAVSRYVTTGLESKERLLAIVALVFFACLHGIRHTVSMHQSVGRNTFRCLKSCGAIRLTQVGRQAAEMSTILDWNRPE